MPGKVQGEASSGGVRICWFILVILVSGFFVGTLVELSQNLHGELITCKENLFSLREELIQLGDEKVVLIGQKKDEETKSVRLKDKSQTVLDELLDQQKRVKALQYDLLSAREDLNGMISNCTGSSNKMHNQFNLTLDVLKEKVTTNREYRILLKKLMEEKLKAENSLETMQFTVFDLTKELEKAKAVLEESQKTIETQKKDIERMGEQVKKANKAMAQAANMLQNPKQ